MNLNQLHYFVTLAHIEHYTRAAEMLSITQPSLSHAISMLEQELETDPKATARLEAIRQLDDVTYDTAFEPPVSDYELDGLDLER